VELAFIACCDQAIVDGTTNRLSLFNVLDDFNVASFPGVLPNVAVVFFLARKPAEPNQTAVDLVVVWDNKEVFRSTFQLSFQQQPQTRGIANLQGVPITSPGVMQFRVYSKKKLLGTWRVQIRSATGVQLAAAGSPTSAVGASPPPTAVGAPLRSKKRTGRVAKGRKVARRRKAG
jgi:hypothetical protein